MLKWLFLSKARRADLYWCVLTVRVGVGREGRIPGKEGLKYLGWRALGCTVRGQHGRHLFLPL